MFKKLVIVVCMAAMFTVGAVYAAENGWVEPNAASSAALEIRIAPIWVAIWSPWHNDLLWREVPSVSWWDKPLADNWEPASWWLWWDKPLADNWEPASWWLWWDKPLISSA